MKLILFEIFEKVNLNQHLNDSIHQMLRCRLIHYHRPVLMHDQHIMLRMSRFPLDIDLRHWFTHRMQADTYHTRCICEYSEQ